MNFATLAQLLNVDSSTLRRWCTTYREFMTPGASPAKGRSRVLEPHDLRILAYVSTLRDSGHDPGSVHERLRTLQGAGWAGLPDIPPEWHNMDDTMPVVAAAARAGEIAQIAVLQTELQNTRQALQEAQNRADQLASELESARSNTTVQTDKIHVLEVELERSKADVRMLEARLHGYALGGDKPLNVALIIVSALFIGAALVALSFILARLLM